MSYQIIISEKEKCLIVTYKKNLAITECLDIVEEIREILCEMHWNRIIIDTRSQSESFSLIDKYGLSRKTADLFPKGTRLALITLNQREEEINLNRMILLESGIALEIFQEYEKAVEWLLQEKIE